MAASRAPKVKVDVRNVMGVRIPTVEVASDEHLEDFSSRIISSNAKIDGAADSFKEALERIKMGWQ